MKFILISRVRELNEGWEYYFENVHNFEINSTESWSANCDVAVISGDSFGIEIDTFFGGFDLYGADLKYRIISKILERPLRELLVGESIVIEDYTTIITNIRTPKTFIDFTDRVMPKHIIYAPAWRADEFIDNTVNMYLFMKAVLIQVNELAKTQKIETVSIQAPGWVDHRINNGMQIAYQMKRAFEEVTHFKFNYPRNGKEVRLNRVMLLNRGEKKCQEEL